MTRLGPWAAVTIALVTASLKPRHLAKQRMALAPMH